MGSTWDLGARHSLFMCNENEMKLGSKQDWIIMFLKKHGNQKFYKFEE
jgi:hypothetical protein